MKIFVILILCVSFCFGQNLAQISLEEAIQKARIHYPLHQNTALLEESLRLELSRINKNFIPHLKFSSRASYQNEVPTIPINIPNYKGINNDQYQANIELSQPILDPSNSFAKKAVSKAAYNSQKALIQNELYQVQSSVISAYFSTLLLEESLALQEIHIKNLKKDYQNFLSRYQNGIAQKDDVEKIEIEILKSNQERENIISQKQIAKDTLAKLLGLEYDSFKLLTPSLSECKEFLKTHATHLKNYDFSKRPELNFYTSKQQESASQKQVELAKNLPYIDAYAQLGYGNPGLNYLKNEFEGYYVVGVRVNWDFSNLYSKYEQDEIIRKEQLQIASQKEEFLLHSNIAINSHIKTALSLEKQLLEDIKIIHLQEKITRNSRIKVINGVLSINDFLSDVNQLNAVKLEKNYREIEFLSTIYKIKQELNIWDLQ